MSDYSISINAAGSSKDNERDRDINALFPYSGGSYRTISKLTRRDGIWCSCGGESQSVTMAVYDQLLDGETLIKTSDTVSCKCYGKGPNQDSSGKKTDANYAETTFSEWSQAESNAAVKAWAAGTLIIRRFVSITKYTSSGHGSPRFRDGYYTDDISIQGSTVPFTNYAPKIALFDVFRSDDGKTENPESTSVYAKIKLAMTDTAGLSDSPKLRAYYAQDADPGTGSSYVDIASAFSLTAANMGVEKTVKISGTWSNGADYYFLLYFSAGEEVADGKLDAAPRATVPLYISETNNGVAVGQYSTATASDAKFESRWHAYFYNGITVEGGVQGLNSFAAGEQATGGTWIDGKAIYRYVLTATATVSGGKESLGTFPATIDTLISTTGTLKSSDGTLRPVPFAYYSKAGWHAGYFIDENNIVQLQLGGEYSGSHAVVVIFEYTKS